MLPVLSVVAAHLRTTAGAPGLVHGSCFFYGCWHVMLSQAEKLVLAEGSKFALVAFESSYNQGVYGLVANLGSLVVRLLFLPVEEAAFTAFSR